MSTLVNAGVVISECDHSYVPKEEYHDRYLIRCRSGDIEDRVRAQNVLRVLREGVLVLDGGQINVAHVLIIVTFRHVAPEIFRLHGRHVGF